MNTLNSTRFEIVAVIITSLGKFLFYDLLDQRLIFIIIMFAFWGSFIYLRVRKDPEILKEWGFRMDTFALVLKKVLPFGMIAVAACFGTGYLLGTIHLHWHMLPLLIVYPIFGTLQQYLLMSLFAGNLDHQNNLNKGSIIFLTSLLFGLIHYPFFWLMLGTFFLSLFYTFIFLSCRNLYVLGIFHGWIGTIFYFTVMEEDPFLKVFGPILG